MEFSGASSLACLLTLLFLLYLLPRGVQLPTLGDTAGRGSISSDAELSGAGLGWQLLFSAGSLQGVPGSVGSGVHRAAAELLLVTTPCWSSEITAGLGASLEFLKYSCACTWRN